MKREWNGAKWIRRERRLAIYLRDGLACCYCGSGLEDNGTTLSLDHIIPVVHGGNNRSPNLVTSCRKCNSVRGNRALEDFAQAVASYLNRGVTARDIIDHVQACANRPLDMRPVWRIMAKRAGWQRTLEEANTMSTTKPLPCGCVPGTVECDTLRGINQRIESTWHLSEWREHEAWQRTKRVHLGGE